VIRRRTFVLTALALCGGWFVAAAHPPSAAAQDEGRRKRDKKEEEAEEKTPEEKELEAIGKEFKAKDVDALIARVPRKNKKGKEGRVRLRLGREDGTYKRTQAKGVIEKWLESRTITSVELESTKDLVGTFTLKFRRRGEEPEVERTLVVRIARHDDDEDKFVLKELGVHQQ
jgi:hypothetical protein